LQAECEVGEGIKRDAAADSDDGKRLKPKEKKKCQADEIRGKGLQSACYVKLKKRCSVLPLRLSRRGKYRECVLGYFRGGRWWRRGD